MNEMDFSAIIFYVFAVIILATATFVVVSRNIVRAAFALLFTLMGVAAFYALLMADFLAVTQLLVYVGGILVLLLFGVMLTNRQVSVDIRSGTMQTLPAVFIVSALAGTLGGIIWSTEWPVVAELAEGSATAPVIGRMFLSSYLLPFEIASVILLVALIGAALIARRERTS